MRLSSLQKFILKKCYQSKNSRIDRNRFLEFYKGDSKAKKELHAKIITGSLESLIDKDLMTGFGSRTSHKWFIRQVSLTAKGKKQAQKLIGEQLKLKFRK